MGGYSSDSDDSKYRHHSKKHRKRRSRSRSYSSDESRSRRRHKKSSKKSKHRRRSRSRSKSSDRSYRSYSRRSRSRGRGSKSRSPYSPHPRKRRSRSSSRSRSRRSPRSRRRSGSRTKSRQARSKSDYKARSRSTSMDSTSRASSVNIKQEKGSTKVDPCSEIPGFESMSAAKQAELRLQIALKAAAAADQKLQDQGLLPSGDKRSNTTGSASFEEQQKRVQDIEDIERDDFEPAMFKSSRSQASASKTVDNSHSDAMFGGTMPFIPSPAPVGKSILSDVEALFGPIFNVSAEEKMERWRKKLMAMRRRKLEGEAMS